MADLTGELGRLAFGAEQDENMLPSELNIEQGRRLTSDKTATPEQARRAPSEQLAFSPLRLQKSTGGGSKAGSVNGDAMIMDLPPLDDAGWGDDNLMMMNAIEEGVPLAGEAQLSSPKVPKEIRQKRQRPVALDRVTEMSTAELQAQVRDPSATLMTAPNKTIIDPKSLLNAPMWSDLCALNEQFANLFVPIARDTEALPADAVQGETIPDDAALAAQGEELMPLDMDDYMLPAEDAAPLALHWPPFDNGNSPRAQSPRALPVSSPNKRSASQLVEDVHRSSPAPATNCNERWQRVLQEQWTPLGEVMPMRNKREAAQAFFELLLLRTKGMIQGKQESPYGAIEVKALPALYQ